MKKTIYSIAMICTLATGLMLTSCKKTPGPKGETGTQGPKGETGPEAKTFNFNLNFNVGDTYKSYNGITGCGADDVLLFYINYETLAGTKFWAPLPAVIGTWNVVPEFSDVTSIVFVNISKSNGASGSAITANVTLGFKAVLIKSSQRLLNPNVNLNDYKAVKAAYKLQD